MTEFLKKHSRTHEKASLRNSRQESNLFAFPGLSGTISNRLAAQQAARPTTIYREDSYGQKSKYECEYDVYGHVVSVRLYEWNNDSETYEFRGASVREYHQLPNGEFVNTKEESEFIWNEKQRYTAAYDNKGMQLWYQGESFDFNSSTWSVDYRTEARIENGIR
ncbi:MAG: hypothetical protein LBH12_05120, partial [Dysgonamonadaceae bacterium]|nr:hypothetical protein [Dysgonamonadaceae bacterium]